MERLNILRSIKKDTAILIIFTIFIVINILIAGLSFRFDLSQNKAYSLSPSTKKIINQIDKQVNLKLYISADLPSRLVPIKADVLDLIEEYRRYNRSKIKIEIVDPKNNTKAAQEIKDLNIPQVQMEQVENDKLSVSNSYFGMGIFYQKKTGVIPMMTNIGSLEYDLTAAIYKMTKKQTDQVGVIDLTALFNPNPSGNELSAIKSILTQQYDIVDVSLTENETDKSINIDKKNKTILVWARNMKYTNPQIKAIDKYLKNGGKVILLADGMTVNNQSQDGNMTSVPADNNISLLLKKYGVTLNKDFILSTNALIVGVQSGAFQFPVEYNYWFSTANFDRKNILFSNIRQLVFPWSSSITVKTNNNVVAKTLVKTNDSSWRVKGKDINLQPDQIKQPQQQQFKTLPLIVELTIANRGKLLIIPTSRFIDTSFGQRATDNFSFILNIVNNYASFGALSGIQARSVNIYPLNDLSDQDRNLFKIISVLVLPLAMAFFGLYRLVKRSPSFRSEHQLYRSFGAQNPAPNARLETIHPTGLRPRHSGAGVKRK